MALQVPKFNAVERRRASYSGVPERGGGGGGDCLSPGQMH